MKNKKRSKQPGSIERKAQRSKEPSALNAARMPIVGVGASAGGLEAFRELLRHLPTDTGLGFVLVQHLDPVHESALTQILMRATTMPVHEATNNSLVEPNRVYIIPPNTNLTIVKGRLKLQPRQKTKRPTRSIDIFFESLAQDRRERAIGVILSGTASDGTMGLEAIKAEDGLTFAQDESAKYDSMPRSAIAAGCVDFVLAPEHIAKELARIARHPYVSGKSRPPTSPESPEDARASATAHEDDATPLPSGGHVTRHMDAKGMRGNTVAAEGQAGENGFKRILLLLRNHCGVDFSLYKSTTIQRRITRRMVLGKHTTPAAYAQFLRGNAKELDALYSDVLISVTSFFRNPDAFDVLRDKMFPKLLQQRGDDPLRIWVLGCSTGQEAYSLAMTFVESAEHAPRARVLQIFATDLNDALLEKARQGLYAKTLVQDLAPERVRRFFVEEEAGYRIIKPLREMVVFARQNLIGDPPFSRMDLISCRNLLIYLEPSLQQKAIPTFHYALKQGGLLFLGASESIGGFTELFEPADKKHKLYVKKAAPTPAFHLPLKMKRGAEYASPGVKPQPLGQRPEQPLDGLREELNSQREADRITVNRFAPPGVLVNAELQILQFRGPTGAYLQPPSTGKASLDVLKMAREGLMLPLRAAINKAKKDNTTARRDHIRIEQNGKSLTVNVEVIPLKNLRERCFLIVFENAEQGRPAVSVAPLPTQARGLGRERLSKKVELTRSHALETELSETRDYLQSIQEQHEAANEELQASNEEVQSANEELQSVNEELETSKEELESTNEELTTVNEEMVNRNAELSRLNADLNNLHVSVNMAILVLTRNLTIRRFTSPAAKLFNLMAADIGRPVSGVRHNFVEPAAKEQGSAVPIPLEDLLREVIDQVSLRESEVRDKDGRWYSLRARPYMASDNKIDGAVLVLVDINDLKQAEQRANDARLYAEATIRTMRDPIVVLHKDFRVNTTNEAFYSTFQTTQAKTVGRLLYELGDGQWDIPKLRTLLEEILPRDSFFDDFEVTHDFPQIGRRTMLLNARRLDQLTDMEGMILLAIEDVTEGRQAEESLRRSHAELESYAEELSRFNRAAVGRELRMIELKKEINELCGQQGQAERYSLEFEKESESAES
ncbi:MAG: PAS domain-containing protein [Nitrospira sp.]|nr:PAS domain-containing protein [Nitrospira sp.]